MPRTYATAEPGQAYAAVWMEWHVDCAEADCVASVCLAGLGEAQTITEAEAKAAKDPRFRDWTKRRRKWYCPKHAKQ